MKNIDNRKWIGLKDVILTTLLTALFIVVMTVVILPFSSNLTLVIWIASGIELLICGPIYVLMFAKSPRRGTLLLFASLIAIYYYFTNSMIAITLIIFAIGIIMELLMLKSGYKSPVRLTVAYALLGVGVMMAPITLLLLSKDSLVEQMKGMGLTQEYIDDLLSVYSTTNILIGIAITIVGAVLGFLIGYKMLKKHFAPAGIVNGE